MGKMNRQRRAEKRRREQRRGAVLALDQGDITLRHTSRSMSGWSPAPTWPPTGVSSR